MDLPIENLRLDQKFEDVNDSASLFHCDLFDSEVVQGIAEILLSGLATACVDNTTGDMFKSPASVAVDIRKEMVEYVTHQSQSFIAESIVQDAPDTETSDDPFDIISGFVDNFAASKQNLLARVSGWLLSEKREDKIDDILQEMEVIGFWLMDRREALAQTLLKNIDFKDTFHCKMKFSNADELARHRSQCIFRFMTCKNEGCTACVCAVHFEKHDASCPFKILPCEQKCSASIMRCNMDKHCITVCPMKIVNCPFYSVGCKSTISQCNTKQHLSEFFLSHLLYVLQFIHKQASVEDLKHRLEQLQKSSSLDRFSETQDVRYFTRKIKELDEMMGPLEGKMYRNVGGDFLETANLMTDGGRETKEKCPQNITDES